MDFFDLHCDTPYKCHINGMEFSCPDLAVNSFGDKVFNNWSQVFAVWISDKKEKPWEFYRQVLTEFKGKLLKANSKVKPIFALEGGSAIGEDIDLIYELKSDEIKLITLTWNGENSLAGGVDSQKGLTNTGKSAIEVMNKLKIGCDLSHLNIKSFYSAIGISEYPLATHCCCEKILKHKRNLKDDQIKLIAEKGGVLGLCLYTEFAGLNVFEGIYKNIYHICSMGLEDIICIGSDFDGAKMSDRLNNITKIPILFSYLEGKGLKKDLLCRIFYENAEKFIAKLY